MILILLAAALAESPAYEACCVAVGAQTCPAQVDVIGTGSTTRPTAEGIEITGLWTLRCGSPNAWRADAKATLRGAAAQGPTPTAGRVITEVSPDAMRCFEAACNFTPDLCFTPSRQGTSAVHCGTQEPAADALLRRSPDARSVAVILKGQVRRAYRQAPGAAARSDATTPIPRGSHTPATASSPVAGFDASLPDLPPNPCPTKSGLREPSNEQVQRGDSRRVEGDLATAGGHYRAAISVNRCNAFAWSGLGHTFLAAGYPSSAIDAFNAATRLMPGLVAAWVSMGAAHEALSDPAEARKAYSAALRYQSGHPEAEAALRRLGTGR